MKFDLSTTARAVLTEEGASEDRFAEMLHGEGYDVCLGQAEARHLHESGSTWADAREEALRRLTEGERLGSRLAASRAKRAAKLARRAKAARVMGLLE